jgi:hypothetical protein
MSAMDANPIATSPRTEPDARDVVDESESRAAGATDLAKLSIGALGNLAAEL